MSETPIASAEIQVLDLTGIVVLRAVTDGVGHFSVRLARAGTWVLRVSHVAYKEAPPLEVMALVGDTVTVEVMLPQAVFEMEPIIAIVEKRDVLHERSYVAALARRATLPRIGNRRVVLADDPELRAAMRVKDIFLWLPAPGSCKIFFLDGRPTTQSYGESLLDSSASRYAAVEFYRRWHDAPRDYRRLPFGPSGNDYIKCSVIAIWTR